MVNTDGVVLFEREETDPPESIPVDEDSCYYLQLSARCNDAEAVMRGMGVPDNKQVGDTFVMELVKINSPTDVMFRLRRITRANTL